MMNNLCAVMETNGPYSEKYEYIYRSRGSTVGIGSRLRPGRPAFFSRQEQWRNFSLCFCVKTDSEAHPASYPMDTRGSLPGCKAARTWSWPLTSTNCRR